MTTRDIVPLGVAAIALASGAAGWLLGWEGGSALGSALAGALLAGTWLFLRLLADPPRQSRRDNPGYRSTLDWYRTRLAFIAATALVMAIALGIHAWVTSS